MKKSYLSGATLLIAMSTMVYFLYLLAYNPKIIEIDSPMKVDKKVYKIGDTLFYTQKYCKYKNFKIIDFERTLVDGYSFSLPEAKPATLPLGCGETTRDVQIVLPNGVNLEEDFRIIITITYQVNPFKTQTVQFYSDKFKIIK